MPWGPITCKSLIFSTALESFSIINCEPASLKSYIMCTFFLTKKSLYDTKAMPHPGVKFNIFSWRVQQENGRFCYLSRKEEER